MKMGSLWWLRNEHKIPLLLFIVQAQVEVEANISLFFFYSFTWDKSRKEIWISSRAALEWHRLRYELASSFSVYLKAYFIAQGKQSIEKENEKDNTRRSEKLRGSEFTRFEFSWAKTAKSSKISLWILGEHKLKRQLVGWSSLSWAVRAITCEIWLSRLQTEHLNHL